jgi:rod shape determining protein RodA
VNSDIIDRRNPQRWSLTRSLAVIHLDAVLLMGLLLLMGCGLMILYSAGDQSTSVMSRQLVRMGAALFVMLVIANIHPDRMRDSSYWLFGAGLLLLLAVLAFGHEGKGAQRWLNLGFFRFQPSELMKLAVPLLVAS